MEQDQLWMNMTFFFQTLFLVGSFKPVRVLWRPYSANAPANKIPGSRHVKQTPCNTSPPVASRHSPGQVLFYQQPSPCSPEESGGLGVKQICRAVRIPAPGAAVPGHRH